MKKIITGILVLSTLVFGAMDEGKGKPQGKKQMKMFQTVGMKQAIILQDGKEKMFCPSCGMTLPVFYKTNHAATHGDHTEQYCSLHCLTETNMKNNGSLKDIKVVDVTTLKFIDANKATYVVGSSKKGTMSMKSKYAFAKKKDANAFAKKFGGKVLNYEKTSKIASKGLEKEMKMIAKRQAKMAQKGEMMYKKMCKKTDVTFNSTAQAKAFVKSSKICGDMKGKKLQAVGIYLGRR
ncbi:nitrous oxide reductase accessory protein NosL [Sulfurimonas sp.]|uniref:nitrous oxide reductase accessory protein NosL n=1 Tax=Sulfurimonas sp. TaxID=2022749 RepID=UPI0025F388BF|nr:nitrous oxide reductase accessory protein NosL [Sulfurimonas sp.]